MTDKLDASAAKALDKLTDGADAIIAKLGTIAEKYGPEVVDSALWVVRVEGIRELVTSAVGLAICIGSAYACWRILNAHVIATKADKGRSYDFFDLNPGIFMPTGMIGLTAVGLAVASTLTLTNVWHWVAIIEPKLWVAKRLLGL
jgi:hypothetical protein